MWQHRRKKLYTGALGGLKAPWGSESNLDLPCPQGECFRDNLLGSKWVFSNSLQHICLSSEFYFPSFILPLLYKHGSLVSEEPNFISFLIVSSPLFTLFSALLLRQLYQFQFLGCFLVCYLRGIGFIDPGTTQKPDQKKKKTEFYWFFYFLPI